MTTKPLSALARPPRPAFVPRPPADGRGCNRRVLGWAAAAGWMIITFPFGV